MAVSAESSVSVDKGKFRVRVITPQDIVFDGEVEQMTLTTLVGIMELLPRHEPVMAPLAIAAMSLVEAEGGKTEQFAVIGGFLDHDGKEATVLADAAESGTDIDVSRAQEAMQRAKERLDEVTRIGDPKDAGIDVERARLALLRSLVRLQAAGQPHKGA